MFYKYKMNSLIRITFLADMKCFPREKLIFDIDFQSHTVFLKPPFRFVFQSEVGLGL